ncbi:alpha/beta hydrolase [uncultured Amphritea sp.]|uniref:alpha/beta fold hydrolase n=1 Tax=uncultured Amphritea sp. TaxID=981605 RepID=UPI002605D87B|nr:alpha/beta hydrolase [uncultured Amphritea sp.]
MTPTIFLPGLICDAAVWSDQSDLFTRQGISNQVIDYGDADSLGRMAEIAIAQSPERFILIGHSMGGRVAMEVARRVPEKISHLILMDTGYLPLNKGDAGKQEVSGRLALVEMAREQGMRVMGEAWMQGMVLPAHLQDSQLCNAILDMIERKTVQQFEHQQTALIERPDATDVLQSLRCPTLFISGDQDSWSPLERHYEMAALVPGSEVIAIEQSGHMCTMEQPKAVNEALTHWLQLNPV